MLDMHRASSKQMHIKPAPTDVLLDVFKPVRAMIHLRSSTAADIQIDCPEHLIIQTDKLRLKQVSQAGYSISLEFESLNRRTNAYILLNRQF